MSLDANVKVHVGEFDLDAHIVAADGETVAVLGPNGAGKTTLLRALAGLTPVDEGRILIDDDTVDDPAAGTYVVPERRSVGVVFQNYLLFPHLTVLENVAFGLRSRARVARRGARARRRVARTSRARRPRRREAERALRRSAAARRASRARS